MDKWNRDGQNLYTDMNAQRRHRRKPDQAVPEAPDAKNAAEEPEIRYDPNIFRRPVVKSELETPAEPETPAVPEEPDLPEEAVMPEEAAADLPEVNDKPEESEIPEESDDSPVSPAAKTKEETSAGEIKEDYTI